MKVIIVYKLSIYHINLYLSVLYIIHSSSFTRGISNENQ